MIPIPPYKTRTHEQLLAGLKFAVNELQLRDWYFDFASGDTPQPNIKIKGNEVGKCLYHIDNLVAFAFIHIPRCKDNNMDPLDTVFHEVWHVYLADNGVTGDDERIERMCNIGALFLMNLYTTKKGKK